MHQVGLFFLPSHVWTKIIFLIDTVLPVTKDADTVGHDPLPPSPLLKKIRLMAEEVANYKPFLCQATNCWMPTASCDSSHLCRGFVDVNENSDGNEMLRVCGRPSCVAGIEVITPMKCVTAYSTGGAKRKLEHERTTPKRNSPWAHAHIPIPVGEALSHTRTDASMHTHTPAHTDLDLEHSS